MDEHISTLDVSPSATPTEAEIAAWNALDRQEQLRRMKQLLSEAEESGFSTSSMNEVIAAAKAELKSKNE